MIKLEHTVLASSEQMEFIIEGMRNPMNSWEKSDSGKCGGNNHIGCLNCSFAGDEKHNEEMCKLDHKYGYGIKPCGKQDFDGCYCVGHNDLNLMQRLTNAGTDHRKFMRMMPVYVRITAPLYWWKEFDTYKVGTVANSCSTMHKIAEKEFTWDDFSCEHLFRVRDCKIGEPVPILTLGTTINALNYWRERYLIALKTQKETSLSAKDIWEQMIQLLPSSYNQTRNVMINYEVLANIYESRRNHKLDEWKEFCRWIEELPYSELICGSESLKMIEVGRAAAYGIQSGIKAYDTAEYRKEHSGWIEEIKNLVNEFEEG